MKMLVLTEKGKSIANAQVHYVSVSNPHSRVERHDIERTNDSGEAYFDRISEWQRESWMLHGMKIYHWNYCVELEVYESVERNWIGPWDFDNPEKVVLKQSKESSPCK